MAVVFCNKFDSDLNEFCSDTAPDSSSGVVVDTTVKKFGAGSAKFTAPATLNWVNFPLDALGNNGTIGFWIYFNTSAGGRDLINLTVVSTSIADKSRITITIDNNKATAQLRLQIVMYDSASALVVNSTDTSLAPVDPGWHYYELNWLWNDAGGNTKVAWDGTTKITNTAGNTKDRSGETNWNISDSYSTASVNIYLDDYTIFNERLHTGDFTVPAIEQCSCGRVPFNALNNAFNPFNRFSGM